MWFSLSVGYSGRAEARWLLPKICEAGNVTKDVIGAIKVRDDESFVQIAREAAGQFGEATELEDGLMMVRLDGMPSFERGNAGPRREAPVKKGYPKKRPDAETPQDLAAVVADARSDFRPDFRSDAPREAAPKKARWSTADKNAKREAAVRDGAVREYAPRDHGPRDGAKPAKAAWAKPAPKAGGKPGAKAGPKPGAKIKVKGGFGPKGAKYRKDQ